MTRGSTPSPAPLRGAARAAVIAVAIGAPTLLGVLVVIASMGPPVGSDWWAMPTYTFVAGAWTLVGSLIVVRRPDSRMGWLILGIGLATALSLIGQVWATTSVLSYGGTLPGTTFGAWLSWLFTPAIAVALLFVPLLFPDGRPPSPRWRIVGVVAGAAIAAQALAVVFMPGESENLPGFVNPTGIPGLEPVLQTFNDVGGLLLLACLPLCILSAVVRFRRGSVIEREQLKWYGSAMGLAGLGIIGATTLPQPIGQACWIGMTIALGLVPVAIAIAILRYRLFEIDRIVGRTVAWAVLTVVLAATFVITNLALQTLLADATGSSTLTTAVATLVVATLFQPVRSRVQRLVDRRFNRTRGDAERVIGEFSRRTRDEVDLERLRGAVVGTAREAVAPEGAGLWLRAGQGRP